MSEEDGGSCQKVRSGIVAGATEMLPCWRKLGLQEVMRLEIPADSAAEGV